MQVLIVEDDPISGAMIRNQVKVLGYQPMLVADGTAAIEVLQEGVHDVVISDWEMPGLNGVELCKRLRDDPETGHIFFILVTGRGAEETANVYDAGVDEYLLKPVHPEDLRLVLGAVSRMIGHWAPKLEAAKPGCCLHRLGHH